MTKKYIEFERVTLLLKNRPESSDQGIRVHNKGKCRCLRTQAEVNLLLKSKKAYFTAELHLNLALEVREAQNGADISNKTAIYAGKL